MSGDSQHLPPGWERPYLKDIARINPPLDRRVDDDSAEVTFVPMRAIESEGRGLLYPETRSYGQVKKGYTSFHSGDVIMAKITPCMENGKTAVIPDVPGKTCFGSTEFHVIRPEKNVDARWIAHYLLQHDVRRDAQRQMTGAVGQMRVPVAFLDSLELPVPPAEEQARTADALDELLSDLEAGVESLQRVRRKLKLYRASVLKAAVEGTLTADWRARHPHAQPASELLKRILIERRRCWEERQLAKFMANGKQPPTNWKAKYKEPTDPDTANLPPLPDGWCWASLDQLADIAGGVTKGQKFSPNAQTRTVPYLRVANVQRGYLDLTEMKDIRALEGDIEMLTLQPGDVLFTEGGDRDKLGRGWVWTGEIDECIHQNHVFRARSFIPELQPKLLSWCGNSYGQRWFLQAGRQSVNLASINMTILRSFPVALPPLSEQEAVVEAVEDQLSVIDHMEGDLDAKLANSQALRQSILRSAFTGHLVPQDPNDEPASELLNRIAEERAARAREAAATKRNGKAQARVPRPKTRARGRA